MEANNNSGIIPEGTKGKDITVESERIEVNTEAAKLSYRNAKERLLDVNHWGELAGKHFAGFKLVNKEGSALDTVVKKGDYIKIDIIGPGTESGDGADWVIVEEVAEQSEEDHESIGIRVKPVSNPTQPEDDSIAHFYEQGSSSSFTVTRKLEKVVVGIYDKNIEINTQSDKGLDKVRNAVYGAIAKIFFSKVQWKLLAEGILGE